MTTGTAEGQADGRLPRGEGRTAPLPGRWQHRRPAERGGTGTSPLQMSGSRTEGGISGGHGRSGTNDARAGVHAVGRPSVGRGRQTTTPAWMSAGIGANAPTPGGLQQQETLLRTPPVTGRTRHPSPPSVGRRRGRSDSCDRPSPRPRSRARHHSPVFRQGGADGDWRAGGGTAPTAGAPLAGILGCRRRSTSPSTG